MEKQKIGLGFTEENILMHLADAWNTFVFMQNNYEKSSDDDVNDFRQAIHNCQRIIAFRSAKRANPEIFL